MEFEMNILMFCNSSQYDSFIFGETGGYQGRASLEFGQMRVIVH